MTGLPVSTILLVTGFLLALIGLWGMLTHRNIMRIIICFTVFDTGLRLVMVATGYITAGTAPIIDRALTTAEAASRAIDPIPSALGHGQPHVPERRVPKGRVGKTIDGAAQHLDGLRVTTALRVGQPHGHECFRPRRVQGWPRLGWLCRRAVTGRLLPHSEGYRRLGRPDLKGSYASSRA